MSIIFYHVHSPLYANYTIVLCYDQKLTKDEAHVGNMARNDDFAFSLADRRFLCVKMMYVLFFTTVIKLKHYLNRSYFVYKLIGISLILRCVSLNTVITDIFANLHPLANSRSFIFAYGHCQTNSLVREPHTRNIRSPVIFSRGHWPSENKIIAKISVITILRYQMMLWTSVTSIKFSQSLQIFCRTRLSNANIRAQQLKKCSHTQEHVCSL